MSFAQADEAASLTLVLAFLRHACVKAAVTSIFVSRFSLLTDDCVPEISVRSFNCADSLSSNVSFPS